MLRESRFGSRSSIVDAERCLSFRPILLVRPPLVVGIWGGKINRKQIVPKQVGRLRAIPDDGVTPRRRPACPCPSGHDPVGHHGGMVALESADDLRTFLFVARTGRLVHAAQLLGVDHTTVGRRISALERQTGARLFDRTKGRWALTPDGERLLEPAERIEAAMTAAREVVDGGEPAALSGAVRVLSTDGFGGFILAPALARLREGHPDLLIELITETQQLGSTARDFDVAVTLEQPTSQGLVHRRLTDYVLHLYATPGYLETHAPLETTADLERHTVIWYVDRLLDIEPLRMLSGLRSSPADIQTMNITAHWQAAASGACVAPLPRFIGSQDARLVRVLPDVEMRRTYWISARREHANSAKVRALTGVLDRVVAERSADLLGA